MHNTLKPYDFHGVEFQSPSADATEAVGHCPYCNHDRPKFYVNLETGQYHCKHCSERGNVYTFLTKHHQLLLERTTQDDWKDLADQRYGVPWTSLRDHGFAIDRALTTPRWIIPVRNTRGAVVNLRTYVPGKYVGGTSGLPLHIWRLEHYTGRGPIYLCEGEWDAIALERLRKKVQKPGTVLAVPGAGTFKQDWVPLFQDREVNICFDHDNPGEEGAARICSILQATARTIRIMQWPAELADGWDVRDMVHNELDKLHSDPADVWKNLHRLLQIPVHLLSSSSENPPDPESLDLPKRTSFSHVIKDYRSHYHMDSAMSDGLAIIFATILSIQLPGDPIWLFVVAPPGSGKTMLLSSLQLSPWTIFKSSLTPKSLISGFRTDEGDPSLIPRLSGKVLILKDYTEITAMGREAQEEIYGILRGAYDGHCEKTFGNGLTRTYPNCHFAMLAGVTDIIHGDDRASLGERFLKYQLVSSMEVDTTKHILAAISGMANQVEAERHLQRIAASFTNRYLEHQTIPQPEEWLLHKVVAIAQIISHLRATVTHVGRDELAYRPSPEVGTRLAKQLVKLGQCLALVYGKKSIDADCWRLMLRVALDTAKGWNMDVFHVLADAYDKGIPLLKEVITQRAKISRTTCDRRLDNMQLVGTVESVPMPKSPNTGAGRPAHGWKLSDHIGQLWQIVAAKPPRSTSTHDGQPDPLPDPEPQRPRDRRLHPKKSRRAPSADNPPAARKPRSNRRNAR